MNSGPELPNEFAMKSWILVSSATLLVFACAVHQVLRGTEIPVSTSAQSSSGSTAQSSQAASVPAVEPIDQKETTEPSLRRNSGADKNGKDTKNDDDRTTLKRETIRTRAVTIYLC